MMERSGVSVSVVDGPLGPAGPWAVAGAGAPLCFEGVVRPTEDGRALIALDYEAYEPMAQRELDALAREIVEQHGVLAVEVEHSRGRVPVDRTAFRLRIVGLLTTGDKLVPPSEEPPPWKIRDANGPTLSSLFGSIPWLRLVPTDNTGDSLEALEASLRRLLGSCDAVLATGGVSMGRGRSPTLAGVRRHCCRGT